MKTEKLVKRFDELLVVGSHVLGTRKSYKSGSEYVDSGLFYGFRTSSLSFIKTVFGTDHPYYQGFDEHTKQGIEILKSAKVEVEGGWLTTVRGILSAEIFSDFLEMSKYLLSEGYKDPAAVMIGSVLEEHLRQLCIKNGLPTEYEKDGELVPKKADRLNAELAASNIYNKLDQKNITAWLDLRNKVAHGKYKEYTKEQVELMLQAVTEFMARNSP